MSVVTRSKLTKLGNSTGLTLSREVLDAAGAGRGTEVRIEASPGRIVVTPAEGPDARAMDIFEQSLTRYGRTYRILAR